MFRLTCIKPAPGRPKTEPPRAALRMKCLCCNYFHTIPQVAFKLLGRPFGAHNPRALASDSLPEPVQRATHPLTSAIQHMGINHSGLRIVVCTSLCPSSSCTVRMYLWHCLQIIPERNRPGGPRIAG